MAQTLSHWRCELSVLLAQSATPATLSSAPCASCWPNRGCSGDDVDTCKSCVQPLADNPPSTSLLPRFDQEGPRKPGGLV
ncbi:hypothetical protein QTO34_011166 [Cnephaeus nilssonii]|uniref:Uncharacterized protein n=1 Tax=Cnephaeus nilssonii TaxID=3371016 RepID=A0AA40LDR6_CNENI|nr:hypothetical protein QTO34_011166 [Eptesicus nilssonii]